MVTVIVGTHRPGSNAARIAHYYLSCLSERGVETQLLELENLPHDFAFTDSFGDRTQTYRPFETQMRNANAYVFVVPEYNGSFPGLLKSFIDTFRPADVFHGKKAALIGEATGRFGNVRGLDHLVGVLNYLRVEVQPFRAHLMKVDTSFNAEGELTEPAAQRELAEHLRQFLRFIGHPASI